jgi:hypothetical protein
MTVSVRLAIAFAPDESVTRTTNGKIPKAVGVPEINPAAFMDNPGESDPETNVQV